MRHPRTFLALAVLAALACVLGACSSASSAGAKTPTAAAKTTFAAVAPAKVAPVETAAPTSTRDVLKPHDTLHEHWNIVAYTFISPSEGWLIRTNALWAGDRSPAQILHTSDGGDTWTVQYETNDFSPISITMLDDQHGWVGGGTGDHCLDFAGYRPACTVATLATADGGRTWLGPTVQLRQFIGDASVESSPAGWAVAGRGNSGGGANTEMDVFTVRQQGAAWHDVLTEGRGLQIDFALAGFDPSSALVVDGQTQYRTADTGATWQESTSPCSQDAFGLTSGYVSASFALPPSTAWLICASLDSHGDSAGALVQTNDRGMTWEVLGRTGASLPGTGEINVNNVGPSLDFLDAMHGWYASGGREHDVYRTSDGGRTWQSLQAPGPQVTDVQFIDADQGWLAMGVGAYTSELARTTDGGAHWELLTLP